MPRTAPDLPSHPSEALAEALRQRRLQLLADHAGVPYINGK
ncbi:hypothetical protein ACWGI9_42130 [Streptomyces sp. NPDC054833]